MKAFILAAGAALALAGAAVAQQPTTSPNTNANLSSTAGRDSTGSPQTTTSAGTVQQSGTSSDSSTTATQGGATSGPPSGTAPTDAAAGGATSGGTMPMAAPTMTANTPAGDAPGSYPKCTKRGQDRCTSSGRRGY